MSTTTTFCHLNIASLLIEKFAFGNIISSYITRHRLHFTDMCWLMNQIIVKECLYLLNTLTKITFEDDE